MQDLGLVREQLTKKTAKVRHDASRITMAYNPLGGTAPCDVLSLM